MTAASAPPAMNPNVDVYIGKAAPFAQPILTHIRALVHQACPAILEEIKWSRPFFSHNGQILANMSAFKAHCSLGFWGAEIGQTLREDAVLQPGAMGSFGRITALADLPPDNALLGYLRQAIAAIESGRGETFIAAGRRVAKAPKPAIEVPGEFTRALAANAQAAAAFAAFAPSCRREYVEWITGAKQAATRERRIAQAIGMLAEGKQRNWKYQSC